MNLDKKIQLRLEELRKERIDRIKKTIENEPLDKTLFEIEYLAARNNGHPKHKDVVKYTMQKIFQDKLEQYIKLEENNVKYKF